MVIQNSWRMLKVKWQFEEIKRSCIVIQRIYRGFQGRNEQLAKADAIKNEHQNKFFEEQAKMVQKL